ncbi:MAG: alpha/beta fold hydrolase [Bacteroidia bacterium]|nr:alpha/beta fold hydrolase [Bacteroidia bacterium]
MKQMEAQERIYPKWLDKQDYPFKSNYFELPMGRMHYVDEGQGDPIVMVHGNPGWSFEFREVIKELSKTHRCIAPDHIGFGFSDKPYTWDYLPIHHAENFEKLMDNLKLENITLIVNDWGGPIGLSYAIKHPEKIKKLIVLNTYLWSVKDDPYYQKFSNIMGGPIGKFGTKYFNMFGKMVVKKAVGDKRKLSSKIHKCYYKHFGKPNNRKGCWVFPREITRSYAWLDSMWQQRQKINSLPTTFIWGMKDIAFREPQLNYWISNWNNPKVIKLDNVGHYPQEEDPQVVIAELRK